MITLEAYWQGRDTAYANELNDEIRANAAAIVDKANELLACARRDDIVSVTSGWRPPSINATVGGAPHSKHMHGLAVDLPDADGSLAEWCMANVDALKELGVWLEHPGWTVGWLHVQTIAPGNPPNPYVRVFIPSSAHATTARFGLTPVYRA